VAKWLYFSGNSGPVATPRSGKASQLAAGGSRRIFGANPTAGFRLRRQLNL